MNKVFLSLVTVMAAFAVFMVIQATKESSADVLIPSALAQHPSDQPLHRIRVGGKVADMPIDYKVEPKFLLSFSLIDPGKDSKPTRPIPVLYEGIRPDMFAVGRDVIVDGEYVGGTLRAAKLLTQCPSKYEPPAPGGGR